MVKKKRPSVSTKLQLLVATGTVLLLVAFGFFVAWLDSNVTIAKSDPVTFSNVTLKGETVCLSHKGDGPQTLECALGLKTASGAEYMVKGKTLSPDTSIEVTGKLMAPSKDDVYKSVGTLVVE